MRNSCPVNPQPKQSAVSGSRATPLEILAEERIGGFEANSLLEVGSCLVDPPRADQQDADRIVRLAVPRSPVEGCRVAFKSFRKSIQGEIDVSEFACLAGLT